MEQFPHSMDQIGVHAADGPHVADGAGMPILQEQQKIFQEQQKILQEQMLKQMVLMNEKLLYVEARMQCSTGKSRTSYQ
jgi:hypothetical protein